MSKTDSSLRLLAILRFTVPSNSSRTLNATQAYDVTSSGITLASATGTLVDKDAAVKTESLKCAEALYVGLSITGTGGEFVTAGAEKQFIITPAASSATLSTWLLPIIPLLKGPLAAATTIMFNGTATVDRSGLSNKSKATNPNTSFYGAITVGTGDYKKWQGKYAVLKINTVTGKGVLRIYDDA